MAFCNINLKIQRKTFFVFAYTTMLKIIQFNSKFIQEKALTKLKSKFWEKQQIRVKKCYKVKSLL